MQDLIVLRLQSCFLRYFCSMSHQAANLIPGKHSVFGSKSESTTSSVADQIQVSDQAILDHMRTRESMGVIDLTGKLGVTDTAVRQRLTRLMNKGFVERFSVREGRGRPKYAYRLTESGDRESGANLDDLAVALWQEITGIADVGLRQRLIQGVIERLVARYCVEIRGNDPVQRMRSVAELFNRRGIPVAIDEQGPTPRLKVLGCPYPGLRGDDRYVCSMEQILFQRLIGVPLENVSCEVSDHGCCEFEASEKTGPADLKSLGQKSVLKNACGAADSIVELGPKAIGKDGIADGGISADGLAMGSASGGEKIGRCGSGGCGCRLSW